MRVSFEFGRGPWLAPNERMLIDASFNATTRQILDAAIEVHRTFGPGLLESAYLESLQFELSRRKIRFDSEHPLPLIYKGQPLRTRYRVDLIVENLVVVEVKAVATTLAVHDAQVITYLKLTGLPVGLLINFNVSRLMDGVKRFINPRSPEIRDSATHK